jgi:hypothetical protein
LDSGFQVGEAVGHGPLLEKTWNWKLTTYNSSLEPRDPSLETSSAS